VSVRSWLTVSGVPVLGGTVAVISSISLPPGHRAGVPPRCGFRAT
jgi:hypothetical protein